MANPRRLGGADRSTAAVVELAFRLLIGAVALAFVAAVGFVGLVRLGYPYPLEWMEGGVVLHVRRVLHGHPLYVRPSLEFTPFIYPPLYYYVTAGVAVVTGVGFLAARLVSFVSTLGCLAVIWYLVRRETGTRAAAAAAVGLFAAVYPLVGTWYDLARVDMLFLFLSLVAIAVVRFGRGRPAAVVAGGLFALALFTKQSALVVLGPVVLWALWSRRRFGLVFAGVAAGLVVASTVLLQAVTDGWFLYYVLFLPMKHEIATTRLLSFWTNGLLPPVLVATAFAAGAVVPALRRGAADHVRFYPVVLAGLVTASWQARLHLGGWLNTLVPAYAAVAILFGLGVDRGLAAATQLVERAPVGSPSAIRSLVLALVLVQLGALGYAPVDYTPTADDRRRGAETARALDDIDGSVFSPVYPYLATKAGHEPVAHKMALVDVLRAPAHDAQVALRENMTRAMRSNRYRALLFHHRRLLLANFTRGYRYAGPFASPAERLVPMTGVRKYPRHVFVPANRSANANHGLVNERRTSQAKSREPGVAPGIHSSKTPVRAM